MPDPLVVDREAIAELCPRHGVPRLAVIGSVISGDFDAERSDVDLLGGVRRYRRGLYGVLR